MPKKEESLTPVGSMNYKELGPSLVKAAQEKEREATQQVVIAGVQSILKDINAKEQQVIALNKQIDKQRARVEALQKGEFTVKYNFDMAAPKVEFNDSGLNGSL